MDARQVHGQLKALSFSYPLAIVLTLPIFACGSLSGNDLGDSGASLLAEACTGESALLMLWYVEPRCFIFCHSCARSLANHRSLPASFPLVPWLGPFCAS
jgi:hypothetical protein